MAEYNSPAILTGPGPTLTFNAASGDTYYHAPDDCSGLDMAPLRNPTDNMPRGHGGIVYPRLFGARPVVLAGVIHVVSSATEAGYLSARRTMMDNMVAALVAIMDADGTYSWTPTGAATRSVTVRADIPATFPSRSSGGVLKGYVFGLIAADPTIS